MIILIRKVHFCIVFILIFLKSVWWVSSLSYQTLFSKFSIIPRPRESIEAISCHKLTISLNFLSCYKIHTLFCDPVFHIMLWKSAKLEKGNSPPWSSIIRPPGDRGRHLDQSSTGLGWFQTRSLWPVSLLRMGPEHDGRRGSSGAGRRGRPEWGLADSVTVCQLLWSSLA